MNRARGCRLLLLRGVDKGLGEWLLIRTAHSLLKLAGAGAS